jgi:RNA polymerase sigma factor (sigma-70 family)
MLSPDDATLLRDYCATRSEHAFTQIVQRHLPLVFHAALRRLKVPALAEEAVQNAFARLAAKASAVARHPERLRAWLHRTAFLEACTLARREARLSRLPLPPDSAAMHRPELYDRLDEALNALPELDRELILRHCCAGEDYRRIAAAMGKSEAACQKRVERGLLRLSESLGGATAVTAIAGALAAGAEKASALPAAERIAAAALEESAGSSVAGAWTGLATAACIVAALGGGAMGWRQERSVPSAPAPPVAAERPAVSSSPISRTPVRPASAPFSGTLDEVLESIRAGRLGPLVDFLPRATPSDLRAIVSEEDFSIGEGSPPGKDAHDIAFRHWTESDPATAFAWAVLRDRENTAGGMGRTVEAMKAWMQKDRDAANTALQTLSASDRRQILSSLRHNNGDPSAKDYPERQWDLAMENYHQAQYATLNSPERDEKLIAAILAGEREPGSTHRSVTDVFTRLAFRNPSAALEQAARIPTPGLREVVLQELRSRFVPLLPPEKLEVLASTLPPGLDRTRATAALFKNLAASQPAEALRRLRAMPPGLERDAAVAQAGSVLASSDPWALLETLAALRGPVSSPASRMDADGVHGGLDGLSWDNGATQRAMQFALQDDPARALKLLPKLQTRQPEATLAVSLANAWAATDLPAAIQWVGEHGSPSLRHDFRYHLDSYEPADGGAQLLSLLESAGEASRPLILAALSGTVVEDIFQNGGASLLSKLQPEDADEILFRQAQNLCVNDDFDDAFALAAHATPEAQVKQVIPEIAGIWLNRDTSAAIAWLQAQPPEMRRNLIEALTPRHFQPKARAALNQLTP